LSNHGTIAELLQREPDQWGARGDPYLWRALAERFQATPLPPSQAALLQQLHQAFSELTGKPISTAEHFHVERFAHGGMSSGHITPQFWRETAIPLLSARYAACSTVVTGAQIRGALYGLLIGDALGVPYEFSRPEALPALHEIDMQPPAWFARAHRGVPIGTWSDDGAQALCLLASLLHAGRLDIEDFARRMVNWYEHGYMAVDGQVFDVGVQTAAALNNVRDGASAFVAARSDPQANGNGALMRVLPLALWHRGSDADLVRDARLSSLPTHGHLRSALCCALYCLWIRRMLERANSPWDDAVRSLRELVGGEEASLAELREHVRPEAPTGGRGSGYVVDTLRSAVEAQGRGSYPDVVRAAIALGNDTDTTAAVAGGAAGARDGLAAIPAPWLHALRGREEVEPLLERLLAWRNVAAT
jgi:ADP-ribosylglycohydrolase